MFELIVPFLPIMAKVGAYMGIVGGLFNCMTKTKYKLIGFTIWILSNTILITWALEKQEYELAEMYAFFFITSGIGLYTHWKYMKEEESKKLKEGETNAAIT